MRIFNSGYNIKPAALAIVAHAPCTAWVDDNGDLHIGEAPAGTPSQYIVGTYAAGARWTDVRDDLVLRAAELPRAETAERSRWRAAYRIRKAAAA